MSTEYPLAVREAMRRWIEHPAAFVREVFRAEPDAWQEEVLETFPHHPKIAMSCAKGPGKTTVEAWLGWNMMATRVDCQGVATSTSGDNLRDVLWKELAYWHSRSPLLQGYFRIDSERITSLERPKTWWIAARSYPRTANPNDQALVLQGLHGKHIIVLVDEAGGVPRAVLATAEAILAGGGDQHVILGGNPNNRDSALGQAVVDQRDSWKVFEVTGDPDDPKRSPRISVEWAKEQIRLYGRDNPWVLVNVFGKFPPAGLNTLLSPDEVIDAQKRGGNPDALEAAYRDFPLIAGIDVARFGDDESVVFLRRGKIAYPPLRMRNLDTIQGASHISRIAREKAVDSIQIDATGGYGSAWLDGLRSLGHSEALGVQFGGKASAERRYLNKRAEIFWELAGAIKDGLMLPPVAEMVLGLSSMQYTYTRDGRIQLEEKDQIKARIGRSPDLEDALACTYAYPVHVVRKGLHGYPELSELIGRARQEDYDPWTRGLGPNAGDSYRG